MRKILSTALLAILFIIVVSDDLIAVEKSEQERCKIGYGYSNVLFDKERHELILEGFKYGLKEGFNRLGTGNHACANYDNIELIVEPRLDKSKLGAMNSALDLTSNGALLIAGFSTSHEAMLAARVAKEEYVAFVAPGTGTSELSKYKDFVFSTSLSNSDTVLYRLRDMSAKYGQNKILVTIKSDSAYSVNMFDEMNRINGEYDYKLNFVAVYLNENDFIDESVLNGLDINSIGAIFITTYPAESKKSLSQLIQIIPKSVDYYVAGAWAFMKPEDLFEIRRLFKNPVRAVSIWPPAISQNMENKFVRKFTSKYKTKPRVECAHGYDAGVAVAHILYNAKEPTRASILQSLRKLRCMKVDTVGELCRRPDGFAGRGIFWLAWTQDGFVIEK